MAIIIGLLFVVQLLNLKEFLQLDLFYSERLEISKAFANQYTSYYLMDVPPLHFVRDQNHLIHFSFIIFIM